MTDEYLYNRYQRWMDDARQTDEKHIRYVAELITKDFEGGFGPGPNGEGGMREMHIPWTVRRNRVTYRSEYDELPVPSPNHYFEILVKVPKGMQGFALQLVIEDQLRLAVHQNGQP